MTVPAAVSNAQEAVPEVPPQTPATDPPDEPAGEKKTYRWQPTDAEGNALGGVQVIEYTTPEELADKMRDINTNLHREMRKWKREAESLRPPDTSKLPANAERMMAPKPLTETERVQLSKDLLDPAKMEGAFKRLREADGETERDRHARVIREAQEADTWANTHPDFHASQENCKALVVWCRQRNLLITQANLDLAYVELKEAGLLLEAPNAAVQAPPNPPEATPPAEPTGLPATEVTPPPRRPERPSSGGLTRSQMSSGGGPPTRRGLTWADVDKMSGAEYEAKYRNDPNFRKQVDALPPR